MKKHYEVRVVETCKPIGSKEDFTTYNKEIRQFLSVKECRDYIKEKYGTVKRQKIYQDYQGQARHIGYIYCFKNSDISHNSKSWYQQDWVNIYEVKSKIIL